MDFEAAWRLAQEPVPPVVFGAWALLAAIVAVFIVRFRTDWREGVKAGAALVVAAVALGSLVWQVRRDTMVRFEIQYLRSQPDVTHEVRCEGMECYVAR